MDEDKQQPNEKLGIVQRKLMKIMLKKAKKVIQKERSKIKDYAKHKEKVIKALLKLNEDVIDIEIDGEKTINEKALQKLRLEELEQMFDQVLEEAQRRL